MPAFGSNNGADGRDRTEGTNPQLKNAPGGNVLCGADGRDRTCDLLVTNELLYQLSYIGTRYIISHLCYNRLHKRS